MTYRVHKVTPSDLLGNPVGVTNGAANTTLIEESFSSPGSYVGIKATTEGALVTSLIDHYGVQQYLAPNGEVVAIPLYKLVGDSFSGATLDSGLWTTTLGTGGSATISGGELTLSTGTTANNAVELTSVHIARFSGLAPNKLRIVIQLPVAGVVNSIIHWGMLFADNSNGASFRMNGTTFELTTLKNGVESVIASGSFNGQYGSTFTPGTTSHFYEIIWQPRQVVWLADNKVIHTLNANATPWTETLHLPIHIGIVNSGGSTTNVSVKCRLATAARFGIPQTQPDGFWQAGTTAGVQLKQGPGNLWGVALTGVANGADVTLYDGTSTAGSVIFSTGAMGPQTAPLSIPLYGEAFNTGLFLTVTGAAANAKISFD